MELMNSESLTKKKHVLISLILVTSCWLLYWIGFFSFHAPSILLLSVVSVTVSVIIQIILPSLIILAIIPDLGFQKKQDKIYSEVAISALGGFVYISLSGLILHYLSSLNFLGLTIAWGVIPTLLILLKRKQLAAKLWAIYDSLTKLDFAVLVGIFFFTFLTRIPSMTLGETGTDSFVVHILSNSMIMEEYLVWALSPLSLIHLAPPMVSASPIIIVGGISVISGLSVHISIFVFSIQNGLIFGFTSWILVRYLQLGNLFAGIGRNLALSLLIFMPLVLKFSDWTASGRILVLVLSPAAFLLFMVVTFSDEISIRNKIPALILTSASLIFSHGMGRIFLVFGLMMLVLKHAFHFYERKRSHSKSQMEGSIDANKSALSQERLKVGRFNVDRLRRIQFIEVIAVIGILAFLLPYILRAFGWGTLVGTWIVTRSQTFISFGRDPLGLLLGFLFIFSARLGFVSPLSLLAVVLTPKLAKGKPKLVLITLTLILLFPLFPYVMYFYQSLAIPLAILAAVMGEYLVNHFYFPKCLGKLELPDFDSKKALTLIFILFTLLSSLYIQSYRYESEDAAVSADIIQVSSFIETDASDEKIVCLASNGRAAKQLMAFSPISPAFPMEMAPYIAYFKPAQEDFEVLPRELSLSIHDLVDFVRYGPYVVRIPQLTRINGLSSTKNTSEFLEVQDEVHFVYLLHYTPDDWPLLDLLIGNGIVSLAGRWGLYSLYEITTRWQ